MQTYGNNNNFQGSKINALMNALKKLTPLKISVQEKLYKPEVPTVNINVPKLNVSQH